MLEHYPLQGSCCGAHYFFPPLCEEFCFFDGVVKILPWSQWGELDLYMLCKAGFLEPAE
jgi:hypothetical protein